MLRDTILILENEKDSREQLVEIFREKYKILEVANEKDGIALLQKHAASIAIILLNPLISAQNNFQVLQRLSEKKYVMQIPFIMISSVRTMKYEKKVYQYGIVGCIKKPFDSDVVRMFVDNMVNVFQYKFQLESTIKNQNEMLKKQNNMLKLLADKQKNVKEMLVQSLSNIVEFRNLESE